MMLKRMIIALSFSVILAACDEDDTINENDQEQTTEQGDTTEGDTTEDVTTEDDTTEDDTTDGSTSDAFVSTLPQELPTPDDGMSWKYLINFSNEFDHDLTSDEFTDNWQNRFFNGWQGPNKTRYTPSSSTISDGMLRFEAKIVGQTVQTGCISSKEKVAYPLYMEVKAKLSNSSLSTAVWMLSDDSTQEIDNLEAYGKVEDNYFSKRLHLSHHVFIRNPFQDYQPTGNATWYTDGRGTVWSREFHTYGVLWWGPTDLRYFVDGEQVRAVPENEIDPNNFTEGTGLVKPMHLIISQAAQGWRETLGQVENYLTDVSVTDPERTVTLFDYIRVFKPE